MSESAHLVPQLFVPPRLGHGLAPFTSSSSVFPCLQHRPQRRQVEEELGAGGVIAEVLERGGGFRRAEEGDLEGDFISRPRKEEAVHICSNEPFFRHAII